MANSRSECVDTARQALNLFTGEELETYIKQVLSRTKELQKQGLPFPEQIAIREINKENLQSLLDDSARSARDINKWEIKKAKMENGVRPKSFLDKTKRNTDDNIETANNASKQELYKDAYGDMTKENLDLLEGGEIDDQVFATADSGVHADPIIKKMGNALSRYIESRNTRLIKSDAMRPSELHRDRFFKNHYNSSLMLKMGKENWVTLKKSLTDIEETFKNTRAMNENGEISDAIVTEMIGNTYDNIIQGNGPLFTKASVARDSDAIERSRHMFYIYKDWKSWGIGNKAYGQGSLMKSWLADINTSGQQIGMAQVMGTQPQKMWLEMRHLDVKINPPTTTGKIGHEVSDALFNQLLGAGRGSTNPNIANIGASIRALTGMARLGKVVLRSVADIANIGGVSMRAGMGYWNSYFSAMVHVFDLIPSESRKVLARTMASSLNVHSGTVSRYVDTAGMGDFLNKASNKFYHGIGLTAWDRGNKLSAMDPIIKGYGRQSNLPMKQLNQQQQAYLERFNITSAEWDSLRAKTKDNLFSTDNVDALTNNEVRELWNKSDGLVPLSDYKSTLYRKVFAMFDTAHEFAVLNPTAFSNMITTLNQGSGSLAGQAIRMIMQFKAYPMQSMRRVFVGGMQDFDSYQAKMMYATNMAIGTIMLGMLSETLVSIANGLTPPDPSKMSRGQQFKYYTKILAGGLGVFSTILNDNTSSKDLAAQLWSTPTWKFVFDPLIAGVSLATGDLKGAKNAAKDFVNVANPIATVPILSPYIDAIVGNKPYMEPGQRQLF